MVGRGRANPLALAILSCLHERPMHPYEVAQTLRSRHKHESIRLNYGSLYSVVEGLERRSLIGAKETVRDGKRPERTIYEITEAGRRELIDWLSELVAVPEKEYLQFEAALSLLPALPPDDVLPLLHERIAQLEHRILQQEAVCVPGLSRLHLLEHHFTTSQLQAELAFARHLAHDIEVGGLDGIDEWRGYHQPQPDSKGDPHP